MENIERKISDNTLYAIATICAFLTLCVFSVSLAYSITHDTGAENDSAVTENLSLIADHTSAIYCGSCGAHVHNWWYVENINNGEPVEVCGFCYNNYIENTATEN